MGQGLSVDQIGHVEPFGESVIDCHEQLARLGMPIRIGE
jgi:hypothetical protein